MTVEELAQAFAVRMQGRWMASEAERLRKRLGGRGVIGDDAALEVALERARAWFFDAPAHLFVCGGRPCRERARDFAGLSARLGSYRAHDSLSTDVTGCQGPCKHAPVATLRVGERCAMFAQVHEACDWEAVLDYAGRAAAAGTLLVDPGHAQAFVFDRVHGHAGASVALRPLALLIGRFTGQGRYAGRAGSFHKEVVGSWEAGARFIALRMAVTYPLDDGRSDVHHALVLVGYNDAVGALEARAYTDSGTTRDYTLTVDGDRVLFSDRVPGHALTAARARKVLAPRPGGYDEMLEVQAEGEPFRPYSTCELRVAAGGRHE
jgi:hypothetical protein